jgi:hypothetical protein
MFVQDVMKAGNYHHSELYQVTVKMLSAKLAPMYLPSKTMFPPVAQAVLLVKITCVLNANPL